MIQFFRRFLTITILAIPIILGIYLVSLQNNKSLFADKLLDTNTYQGILVVGQTLIGLLSILVTFSFLFAQIALNRYTFIATVNEFYKLSRINFYFTVIWYIIAYTFSFIICWNFIVVKKIYFLLDIFYFNTLITLPIVGLFIIVQVEALDLSKLLRLVTRNVTIKSIKEYGLVEIKYTNNDISGFEIKSYNTRYAKYDPLRSFHEVMMTFVNPVNRLLITDAFESLFRRICILNQVNYKNFITLTTKTNYTATIDDFTGIINLRFSGLKEDEQIYLSMHIMHYVVRRCKNFNSEITGEKVRDSIRQNVIRLLCNLVYSLSFRKGTKDQVNIILVSTYYVQRILFCKTEPLLYDSIFNLLELIQYLKKKGCIGKMNLCLAIITKLVNDGKVDIRRLQENEINNLDNEKLREFLKDAKDNKNNFAEYDKYKDCLEKQDAYKAWREYENI